MLIECVETIELPFMLNIPSGEYLVGGDAVTCKLALAQEQVVACLLDDQIAIGNNTSDFRSLVSKQFNVLSWHVLKTLVVHKTVVNIATEDVPQINDHQLHEAVQRIVMNEDIKKFGGKPMEIQAEASARITQMEASDLARIRFEESVRIFAKKLANPDLLLLNVNRLIRLYMAKFNDFFVEEVTLHQIACNVPIRGVFTTFTCDGQHVHTYDVIGKFPPMMFRPWREHSSDSIDEFKSSLERGEHPSAPELMAVRSRNCLEKGAYRSAIVEASAALDLSLSRKIREGLRSKGSLDTDIDLLLRKKENQGFADRAKALLQSAVGTTVPALDNTLWAAVSAHRTQVRQGVTHSDAEPEKAESEQVVEDFLKLAEMIRSIPVT